MVLPLQRVVRVGDVLRDVEGCLNDVCTEESVVYVVGSVVHTDGSVVHTAGSVVHTAGLVVHTAGSVVYFVWESMFYT